MNIATVQNMAYKNLFDLRSVLGCKCVLCIVCDSDNFDESKVGDIHKCIDYLRMNDVDIIDLICDWQGGGDRLNLDEWKLGVEDVIRKFVLNHKPTQKYTEVANIARELQLKIDEDNTSCKIAYEAALKSIDSVRKMNASQRKNTCLPLQGKLWKEWAELQKRKTREKRTDSIEAFISEKQTEQNKLRKEQVQLYRSPSSSFIKTFWQSLIEFDNPSKQQFYVTWMKLFLDDDSRSVLPQLTEKYHQRRCEIRKQDKHGAQNTGCESELDSLEKGLSDASFGLEHVWREIGQIYEATQAGGIKEILNKRKHT